MKSLSEIETTAKRASKAAGFSWGEAEEIGKCIRQLEMFGLPGIKHLNSYFNDKKKNTYENLSSINQSNSSSSNPYCPIILGCLLYTSPSPRDLSTSRMPSSA